MDRTFLRNQQKLEQDVDYLKAEIKYIRKYVKKKSFIDQFVDIISIFVMIGYILWNLNNQNWSEKEPTNGYTT